MCKNGAQCSKPQPPAIVYYADPDRIGGGNSAYKAKVKIRSAGPTLTPTLNLCLGDSTKVIIGLLLLIWGADRFVHGAAATARNLDVAPLMIGLTIVSFATSAPEILVSIVAAGRGDPDLAIGNAIGSNIANIGLVLGTVALFRPIELKSATLRREMPALLAVTLLTISLFLDSYVGRGRRCNFID